MRSSATVTTSPGFSQTGGLRNVPQPAGVPVEMTSPGSIVMTEVIHSMTCGIGKICSLIVTSWRTSPFTIDLMRISP